jgi:glycosyltransferase involved in cell wall biosynthesis
MRILYFYQYFSTPKGSWGTRVYEFASEWIRAGHEVTVVTSIYSKSDIKAEKFIENQVHNGIIVKVINISVDNKQTFIRRLLSFLQYSVISSFYALFLKTDIVIASSGPITVGIPGLIARYVRGRKLVFETRDLWPTVPIEVGIVTNPMVIKFAYFFERVCYKASSFIVTLSPGMTNNIKLRFGLKNVDDVTNAANIEIFSTPRILNSSIVSPKKYAVYTGNIGMINNSYWLYETAKVLKTLGREDIVILMIGEGQQRLELENLSRKEGVTNYITTGLLPKESIVAYLQNSIAALVPLKGTPILDTSSPNKFFESLASGVPIIQTTQGWMREFIELHRVGFTVDSDDSTSLALLLIELCDNVDTTQEMGNRSRIVAGKYFDKVFLANKMLNILSGVNDSR